MFLLLSLLACADKAPATDSEPGACAGSLPPGEVEVFATGFDLGVVGTEGLTFSPDGRLFVGGSGVGGGGYVAEIQPDGSWEPLVEVPGSVGLAWWGERLMVAGSDPETDTSAIYAVDPDARSAELWLSGLPGANFPAVTPWGTLMLADHGTEGLWEILPSGDWDTWVSGVPSPNGVAFSPEGDRAYVANTYGRPNTVTQVEIEGWTAGAVSALTTFPDGSTQDGVAMDAEGGLYVVNNLPGTIIRVSPDGAQELLAEDVNYGASMAFGEGAFDPCSLYVSSLFSEDVFRVGAGRLGLVPTRFVRP